VRELTSSYIDIEQARVDGYARVRGPYSNAGALWLTKCRELLRPWIAVRLYLSSATVEMDTAPAGRTLTSFERRRLTVTLEAYGVDAELGDHGMLTGRLPIEVAEALAAELVHIVGEDLDPASGDAETPELGTSTRAANVDSVPAERMQTDGDGWNAIPSARYAGSVGTVRLQVRPKAPVTERTGRAS
jgi:hypothetical protein